MLKKMLTLCGAIALACSVVGCDPCEQLEDVCNDCIDDPIERDTCELVLIADDEQACEDGLDRWDC